MRKMKILDPTVVTKKKSPPKVMLVDPATVVRQKPKIKVPFAAGNLVKFRKPMLGQGVSSVCVVLACTPKFSKSGDPVMMVDVMTLNGNMLTVDAKLLVLDVPGA